MPRPPHSLAPLLAVLSGAAAVLDPDGTLPAFALDGTEAPPRSAKPRQVAEWRRPADATSTRPGTDPDRAGFSTAWHAARDQLVLAAGVIAGTVVDLVGTIGRHVLAALLPARRLRASPRIVKRAISKYQARGPRIDRTSHKATIGIEILAPPAP